MKGNGLLFFGLWIVLGGYTLTYWGQFMIRSQHVGFDCLVLGRNC